MKRARAHGEQSSRLIKPLRRGRDLASEAAPIKREMQWTATKARISHTLRAFCPIYAIRASDRYAPPGGNRPRVPRALAGIISRNAVFRDAIVYP